MINLILSRSGNLRTLEHTYYFHNSSILQSPRLVVCVWLGMRHWPFGTHLKEWKKNEDSSRYPSTCFLSPTNTYMDSPGVRRTVSWWANCVVRTHTMSLETSVSKYGIYQHRRLTICFINIVFWQLIFISR